MSDGDGATPAQLRASGTDEDRLTANPAPTPGAAPWERFGTAAADDDVCRWSAGPFISAPDAGDHDAQAPHGAAEDGAAEAAADPDEDQSGAATGSHIDGGVSVADLIAKLGATVPERRTHHRVVDEDEYGDEHAVAADLSDDSDEFDEFVQGYDLDQDPDRAEDDEPAELVWDAEEFSDETDDQLDTQVMPIPAYSVQLFSELPDLGAANYPRDAREPDTEDEAPAGKRERLKRARRRAETADAAAPRAPKTRAPKQKSRHRRLLVAGRTLAALVALVAVVATGGAWQWSASKNKLMNTVSALDPQSADIVDPNAQYGDENFLIVGMDSRLGANANVGAGDTEDAGGARSDTVMLVNIPANRQRVVAVSFPRDLAINPIQCEAWNPETGKYGPIYDPKKGTTGPRIVYTETKLNSAFSFGGPKCLVKVIQKLSGLSINRFIAIDFVGFARMVEALGGVEVCSKTVLRDYELGTVLDHAGRQVIDGSTALNYVRARQVTTESNGDYGRIKRQQLFLSSLLRTMISADTLMNLNKLNNVVNMFIGNSYVDNVKTKDLVELGRSLQHMAAGHVTFVTVPTGVTDQDGNEPPRTADMKALFGAIISDDALPLENDHNAQSLGSSPTSSSASGQASGPTTAPTTKKPPQASPSNDGQREQVTTTSPQEVTVQVSNGTSTAGLASTAANQLKRNGFNVMTPDDYPSALRTTTVMFSPGNEQAAATVAAAFGGSRVERVTGIGSVVQVVLGSDFSSVTTPPPSGSSVSVQINRNTSSVPTRLPEDLTVTNAADTTCE